MKHNDKYDIAPEHRCVEYMGYNECMVHKGTCPYLINGACTVSGNLEGKPKVKTHYERDNSMDLNMLRIGDHVVMG